MPKYILTKHARDRLGQRWITEAAIEQTLRSPDRTQPGSKPETVKFVRTLNQRQIEVVGKFLPAEDKWLILSVWVRGEDDREPVIWSLLKLPFRIVWWVMKRLMSR